MRVLVQRVKSAKVVVKGQDIADIKQGLLLLVGVGRDDNADDIENMAKKIVNLRIFSSTGGFAVGEEDEQGRMNLNIQQVKGQILSVPQFTLLADTRKGNRPGFDKSAGPEMAKEYWNKFNTLLRENSIEVREGVFGAHMEVGLINDGPVTIWLDSKHR
ncbi:MAG: D-aminoacyl-tRNA deacylase [Thermodesulfovibrionia bacterium]